jgi:hypothetical protein
MNKRHVTVLAVLLALAVWQGAASQGPLAIAASLVGAVTGPSPAAADAVNPASTPASSTAEGAVGGGLAAAVGAASAQAVVAPPPVPLPALTRSLSGDQTIQIDGRTQRLLGTREITDAHGPQTLLLVRDERSGAIGYWQSGLRFALKPGVDREAFLREHLALRRQFLNTDYADVAADAADLAAAYRTLSADTRVAGVQLLPLQQRVKPR